MTEEKNKKVIEDIVMKITMDWIHFYISPYKHKLQTQTKQIKN